MKLVSQKKALERLQTIISDLKFEISNNYEHRARSCLTCETKGACCLDAHFVNVHISRLEAVAIERSLSKLPTSHQHEIYARIEDTVEKYSLKAEGDTFAQTYACPLFEKGIGCLVHEDGKPVPCIMHACYERAEDLPPNELQIRAEYQIEDLNTRTYGKSRPLLPLPLALRQYAKASSSR
ncbi:MAG: hypothetical protein IPL32_10430 [Chloracidobacterium sp.]|nr:hypothetical protein [Chloracidobacterium sp.]